MNAVKKLAIVLSLGALAVSASAATKEKAYVASYEGTTGQPVPVSVRAPEGLANWGAEVLLEFVVDKNGMPQGISVASSNDTDLAVAAVKAVKEWRFTPKMENGVAVETRVMLPIVASKLDLGSNTFALR
mgnify:CR=1 FL=1